LTVRPPRRPSRIERTSSTEALASTSNTGTATWTRRHTPTCLRRLTQAGGTWCSSRCRDSSDRPANLRGGRAALPGANAWGTDPGRLAHRRVADRPGRLRPIRGRRRGGAAGGRDSLPDQVSATGSFEASSLVAWRLPRPKSERLGFHPGFHTARTTPPTRPISALRLMARAGIEPATPRFSVVCSTN
jgi:hypothetical protein